MVDEESPEGSHTAELVVKKTRLGGMITWSWTNGRRTISLSEHNEAKRLVNEAEAEYDPEKLGTGHVVARIWMGDDEKARRVSWR